MRQQSTLNQTSSGCVPYVSNAAQIPVVVVVGRRHHEVDGEDRRADGVACGVQAAIAPEFDASIRSDPHDDVCVCVEIRLSACPAFDVGALTLDVDGRQAPGLLIPVPGRSSASQPKMFIVAVVALKAKASWQVCHGDRTFGIEEVVVIAPDITEIFCPWQSRCGIFEGVGAAAAL